MTLSFSQGMRNFVSKTQRREAELYRRVVDHVQRSILTGSSVTGAPGQPVKTHKLFDNWIRTGSLTSRIVSFSNELFYAPIIEHNFRGATLRSKVGGFHSVKLTELGFNRIVRFELAQMGDVDTVVFKGGFFREPSSGRFARIPR